MFEAISFLGGVTIFALLIWLVIGAAVGAIAGVFTNSDRGFFANAIVGIVGSFVGGFLSSLLGANTDNWLISLIFSVLGAIVTTLIYRSVSGRATT